MKKKLLLTTAVILSIKILAQIPTNGLVAYYQFNGNANDLSGNNNNGTVNGATLVTDRNGNANSAYSFDGTTSYIDVLNSPSLNSFSSNAMTIAFWGKVLSVPPSGYNGIILSKQSGSGTTQQGFNVAINTSNNTYLRAGSSGGAYAGGGTGTATINVYHHYVLIYDNGTSICYLDGVLINSTPGSTAVIGSNTMNLLIGKANWSNINSPNFNGVIDEMQIYDRGLTSTEITQIYSGTCQADLTTGLVAKYDFSGNANDLSGNSLNGTVTGATLTTDRFGNANSAYLFNGTTDNISVSDNSLLNFQSTNKFSISYWINPTTLSNSQLSVIINKQTGSGTNQDGWNSNIESNFSSTYRIQNGTSTSNCTMGSSASSISTGQTYHITQVYDNGTSYIYINGVLADQTACTALIGDNTSNMLIGKATWTFSNTKGFHGIIDDVRIYNRALTVCDVDSLYNEPNPCTGITANITAGGPVAFCQGGNVVLTASSANSYLWSNSATTQSITVNTAGNYSVTCTNSGGCSGTSAATTVTVNALPVVTANATANSICTGGSVTLTGGGASTYTWTSGITNGTPFSPTSTATYTVTGTDGNGCTNTATKTITVNPLPVVSINTVPNFININASAIALTGSPAGGTFTGNGVNSNNFTPLTAGLGTSQITYNYTNSNNCSNSFVTSTIVYDTTGVLCTSFDTTYISVTDTLVINATLTGINPPNNMNTLRIYPNPATTHIYIDNGNYTSMAGYTIMIKNNLGQTVFTSLINQQQFYIDLLTWSGNGIYFVHIIDAVNNTIEVKKIVLQ
jgi:hypothetical protein